MEHEWWKQALQLEAADKLSETERVIREAMSPRGEPWTAQIAHLYELRCKRFLAAGQIEAARAAARTGHDFMLSYASGATSGGEGVALSAEAEEYRQNLAAL